MRTNHYYVDYKTKSLVEDPSSVERINLIDINRIEFSSRTYLEPGINPIHSSNSSSGSGSGDADEPEDSLSASLEDNNLTIDNSTLSASLENNNLILSGALLSAFLENNNLTIDLAEDSDSGSDSESGTDDSTTECTCSGEIGTGGSDSEDVGRRPYQSKRRTDFAVHVTYYYNEESGAIVKELDGFYGEMIIGDDGRGNPVNQSFVLHNSIPSKQTILDQIVEAVIEDIDSNLRLKAERSYINRCLARLNSEFDLFI